MPDCDFECRNNISMLESKSKNIELFYSSATQFQQPSTHFIPSTFCYEFQNQTVFHDLF
jgi:hypothetical protein